MEDNTLRPLFPKLMLEVRVKPGMLQSTEDIISNVI